ncbi:MAG: type II toxin-antitoxin system HicB family antitoxin [Oscillospiraceae bacterium]|nr:type II toxin-antitoxin system HicB family antitoxin [Oscillospiraceae bacterium]
MSKYEVLIYWSNDDNCFIAEVPALPGCMSDGKSKVEALNNIEIIIEEWLETAEMLNRPIPEPSYIQRRIASGE